MKGIKNTKEAPDQNDQSHNGLNSPLKRRNFIKTSMLASSALFVPSFFNCIGDEKQLVMLPWQREIPLREAAKSAFIENTLNATNPLPGFGSANSTPAMSINNLKMRTTIWGPPNRITISLTKNNVWDRRLNEYPVPTLQEIKEGAFSPANKNYVGVNSKITYRPLDLGWLRKEGGSIDPYREPIRYAFPCLKPVGQIILGIDSLADAAAPNLKQNCSNGIVSLEVAKENARANLEYVLGITSNMYAIRGNFSGIETPVWLRLYRHRDTSHLTYMAADGKPIPTRMLKPIKTLMGRLTRQPADRTDAISGFAKECLPKKLFHRDLNMC